MTKRKNIKLPRKCIFCGGGDLSKEHIWPQWAASLLRTHFQSGPHREEFMVRTQKTKLIRHTRKERQGHVTTKTIRVVCMKCNNEWMSIIESSAQKVATPMILGQPIAITPAMQVVLAKWLALKVMIGEQNQRIEVVVPQIDRNAFRERGIIPSYIRLWIARCVSNKWRNAYLRHSGLLGRTTVIPENSGGKNVQTTALGIGELFVFATASVAKGIDMNDVFVMSNHFLPLWPLPGHDILWPPNRILDDRGADSAAMAFDTLMRDPRVIWKHAPD